jgi:hypothetical protein
MRAQFREGTARRIGANPEKAIRQKTEKVVRNCCAPLVCNAFSQFRDS